MTNDPWENESEWDVPPVLPPPSPKAAEGSAAAPRSAATAPPVSARPSPPVDDHDDVESFPAPPRRGRGFLVFLLILAVLLGASLFGVKWVQRQITPAGAPGAEKTITIPLNTSSTEIGNILHKEGIIGNPTVFRYYVQWKGRGGFEAGQYQFRENESFDAAIATLTRGPQVPDHQKVTFPEGFRLSQIAERVGARLPGRTAERFTQVATNGTIRSSVLPKESENLEGFLFPDTYEFSLKDDEEEIVSRMVDSFDNVADEEGLMNAKAKVGRSPYEVLIVASLIEREAKIDEDRGKVARVIYNRLAADTALQIDATLIYGMGGNIDRVLFEDLQKDGPYNTYTRKGLPPTPIASPGRESIRAALNPTEGDWLYYVVVTPDGHHAFANTFAEHKRNIQLATKNGVR